MFAGVGLFSFFAVCLFVVVVVFGALFFFNYSVCVTYASSTPLVRN